MAHNQRRGLAAQLANAADAVVNVASRVGPLAAAAGGGVAVGLTGDKALRKLEHRLQQAEKRLADGAAAAVSKANVNSRRVAKGVEAISAPITTAGIITNTKPIVTTGRNTKRVVHQELITEVLADGSSGSYFVHYSKPLQPGDGSMGAWLKDEAAGWESYHVNSCTAIYVPSAGTSDRGDVALVVDYDALDAPPDSMQKALSFAQCVTGPVHAFMNSEFDTVSMMQPEKRKFVRDGPLHFLNSRTNDCGRLTIVSEGVTLAPLTIMGRVLFRYDITFYTPHVRSIDDMINSTPITVLHVGQDVSFSTVAIFQTIPVPYTFKFVNNLQFVNDQVATGVIHVPRGVYRVKATMSSSFSAGGVYQPRLLIDGPAVFGFYKDTALYPCSRAEMPNAVVTGNEWQCTFDFFLRVDSDAEDANYFRVSFQPASPSSVGVIRHQDTSTPLGPWHVSQLEAQLLSTIY